jgi:glycosyltransferase domain-containing protein
MLTAQNYSLLIPTFNRPAMLGALLEYLASKKAQFPIFVLDSSDNENKVKNRVVAKRHAIDVRHMEFDEDARFDLKIASALHKISSDYVSLCADDDIVFIDAIEACVDELDRDRGLVACHGIYLNFSLNKAEVDLWIEYASPSIDMDNAVDRACQILMRYEALNYAVYRRQVMVDVVNAVSKTPQDMFWELFYALVPLVLGKVTRLSSVYHARRSNGASGKTVFHPATWIAEDPDAFARAFLEYRERLFKYYEANATDFGPGAKKALTQAHVIYLCRELRDGTGIKHALAGTASPLAKIDLVSGKTPAINFLAHDPWLKRTMRKLSSPALRKWLGGKIRKIAGRSPATNFTSQSLNFRSPSGVRAMLSDETMADLSWYIQTSNRLERDYV